MSHLPAMRTFRRLTLVAAVVAGALMVGSSVSGVASLDSKLDTTVKQQRLVEGEGVSLREQRCRERRERLREQREQQRESLAM